MSKAEYQASLLRTVDARYLPGEWGVGEDLLAEGGVAGDGAPVLAEGDEELPVSGEVSSIAAGWPLSEAR